MSVLANLSTSIVFIICGVILKFWPPEEINSIYGYRTHFAKKNKEVWNEANNFSGTMMIVSGIIALIFSILITFLYKDNQGISNGISVAGSIIIVLSFIFYTEIHLRKIFNKDGKRKSEIK